VAGATTNPEKEKQDYEFNTALDWALLTTHHSHSGTGSNNMLPPISSKCQPPPPPPTRTGIHHTTDSHSHRHHRLLPHFEYSYTYTNSSAKQQSSQWNYANAKYEADIFLLEINITKHNNATDSTRSQATLAPPPQRMSLRLGTGGNLYSVYLHTSNNNNNSTKDDDDDDAVSQGSGLEMMPPQSHASSPFNDEVWQLVSVNSRKNNASPAAHKHGKYFIHQAGTYLRDYDGGLHPNITDGKAFGSPSVAVYCTDGGDNISNDNGNTDNANANHNHQQQHNDNHDDHHHSYCTVTSWGQHVHVPTITNHPYSISHAMHHVSPPPPMVMENWYWK
jgi:hypothetical protein